MTPEPLAPEALQKLEREIATALANRRLEFYEPYPKQREFHAAKAFPGLTEFLLVSGNQTGKTLCASAEVAMHATGMYPSWWVGRRFQAKPTIGWVTGSTGGTTRDNPQRLLLGEVGAWGTGMIPKASIKEIKKSTHGVADSIDSLFVYHAPSGGVSRISFKSYDQGRERWQGDTLDYIWFDEEPPMDIYSEGKTRVQATGGMVFMTFTPLQGMSDVVRRFLIEKPRGTHVTQMTIHDALHYTKDQRDAIIAGYPAHEREARADGVPTMGSGRVFPVDAAMLDEPPVQIPRHWPRICGMDLGYNHPTAAVWMAWDRDTDVVHVYDCYRVREQVPVLHAAAMKARGAWIPVAWPHDGMQHDRSSGIVIAQQYRNLGLAMLKHRATNPPIQGQLEGSGGVGIEAPILDMLERMQTSRLKVASHLSEWWEEFRLYHRKAGVIVKEADDLMSATRYGLMMLRFAKVQQEGSGRPVMAPYVSSDASMGVLG